MRSKRIILLCATAIFFFTVILTPPVFGGDGVDMSIALSVTLVGGGGSPTVSVAEALHSAGDLIALYDELDALLNLYVKESSPEKKKKILAKAKKILAKLIEQANHVESEINIESKGMLQKAYADKLQRVLKNVVEIRALARKRMNDAVKT
jgi:hypothetical protein